MDAIRKRARERGDRVVPGLDQPSLSKHESGDRRPSPYYQGLYCELYGATPVELGFRLALPGENGHPEDVNRREFLAGAAGFAATLALPAPTRLGTTDVARLRQSVVHLYKLDDLHGAGSVYSVTARTFRRLRSLVEYASYDQTTGRALRELTGLTAEHAGWLAFDGEQNDDARRWWLEAMHWARLADADSVSVVTMSSMAVLASDQHRPREVVDLATTAQSTAKRAPTPRLTSALLAREAVGHAGQGNARSAHASLRRARNQADQARHDDDPSWLDFYGPAIFASNETRVAQILGDTKAAESAARAALALNDPVAYSRNHALYLIRLAEVLVEQREIDDAVAVARQATVAAATVDSARINRAIRDTAQNLAPFKDDPGVGRFLEQARETIGA